MVAPVDSPLMAPAERATSRSHPVRVTAALVLSIVALVVSGISVAGWAQASAERQQIESRLVCLELPGPNDCQQDDR
jgi:hypothetical protein